MNDKTHLYDELKYQATSILCECNQVLDWGYFCPSYVQEKINTCQSLLNEIEKGWN